MPAPAQLNRNISGMSSCLPHRVNEGLASFQVDVDNDSVPCDQHNEHYSNNNASGIGNSSVSQVHAPGSSVNRVIRTYSCNSITSPLPASLPKGFP